ncbi:36244_t:CDS:1, partial [Racocetra persica]
FNSVNENNETVSQPQRRKIENPALEELLRNIMLIEIVKNLLKNTNLEISV